MLRFFERLLVFPAPRRDKADWTPLDLNFKDVYFDAEDGTRLHGWYVAHPQPRAVVLYCHGNGEHVARLAPRLKILNERIAVSVFAWDYRSYGRSEGIPHESNVISDAKIAHRWLAERTGTNPADVVIMGRSLGGAVAVALAAECPVRAIVLDRTFSTLTDAASHNFPWLPVRWIMNNRFASIEHIRNYQGPLLQSHGTIDQIVPFHQGRQLFDAAPSKVKKFLEVPDLDHNSPLPDYCYQELVAFLDALAPAGSAAGKQ
ncbi:MAG: alpha/beta hydrolase [Bythopirellula sp.]